MIKKISAIIGILTGLIILITGLYAYDCRVAKAINVITLTYRFDQKVLQDEKFYLQKEIWELEREYKNKPMSPTIQKMYQKMLYQLREKEKALNNLKKGS